MRNLANQLEADLRALGTAERAAQEKRYLKSDLEHLGVTVPVLRKVVVAFLRVLLRAQPDFAHDDVLGLARALWKKPIHERRAAAVEVLELSKNLLGPEDIHLVEEFLRESRGWALVDNLAASVAGDLVERFPKKLAAVLDRWAKDDDFWLRRSSLLALLLPLRRGAGDFERFCRYADGMLEEKEFFIRKAIGWVLRETAKKTPERVMAWLLPRAARASGLTVREACKHLPALDKQRLLAAHAKKVHKN
jgi:3-methyladenine DNA glycosylase AlkD